MANLLFITHPEIVVSPNTPIERWHLSEDGVRRMRSFARSPAVSNVRAVWSSRETKAIEAARILAAALGIGLDVHHDLGENDRSATGYLPPDEFEEVASRFFAAPSTSIRGWETAADAQKRITTVVAEITAGHRTGDLAIVAHGAVGTLLFCALTHSPIDRKYDQPFQGQYWTASLPAMNVKHGWRSIAPR